MGAQENLPDLRIAYKTKPPGGLSPYLFTAEDRKAGKQSQWALYWQASQADAPHRAEVLGVANGSVEDFIITFATSPHLSTGFNRYFWTVTYTPAPDQNVLPQLFNFKPEIGVVPPPANKNCDNANPEMRPNYCPVSGAVPPDVSVSGNFLAAGGTKPIYQLEVLANVYRPKPVEQLWNFNPGINLAVEINQNTKPPNNRTRFDPDSILVSAAFRRIQHIGKGLLYGIEFDEALPGAEFSRSDPSSNLIFKSNAMFVLKPWQPTDRVYGTLYPVIGIEGGKNLNRPGMLAMTAIDLTHYDAITRGLLGAEATLGLSSADSKTDDITLTGSYRVRLPVFDEPFIRTEHEITSVMLTTRARHWVEVDLNITPAKFKFLAFTVKYQYGELPPVFNMVDNKLTIGLTFKAVQSNKPTIASAIK